VPGAWDVLDEEIFCFASRHNLVSPGALPFFADVEFTTTSDVAKSPVFAGRYTLRNF
jgi:hypothetical protein